MTNATGHGRLVAGVDSSTQSTKVLLVDAETGAVQRAASATHPDGTEVDPAAWWSALEQAGAGILSDAAAVGVGAQQHGMVTLDADGAVVRPALLWNDLRSAAAADELVAELGGPVACAAAVGSLLTASFTVAKLRWLATAEPTEAARVAAVALPHDWLTARLAGRLGAGLDRGAIDGALTTDAGDASGTGYFSPAMRAWRPDIAERALGHEAALPTLAAPGAVVGTTATGAVVSAGTGDNMAAALGLGLVPGDVVVSIGTSGTAFAVAETPPPPDPSGILAGFCDATGRYLPLVCTINAARILTTTARLVGWSIERLDEAALAASPGANGVTLLPYLDGERAPVRPTATGTLVGVTSHTEPADLARAAVEALLCSLADAVDAVPVVPRRIVLIGGGARSRAVQQLAPAFFGVDVVVPEPSEYVALGAARQAAWALSGQHEPPAWPQSAAQHLSATDALAAAANGVRERYGELRERTSAWS